MPKLRDFDDHLTESLKDPHDAAYFLAASLQDALDENDRSHFFRAVQEVCKATGKSDVEALQLINSYIAPADFPNVDENLNILLVKLQRELDDPKRNRLQAV